MRVVDSDRRLGVVVYRTWRCPNRKCRHQIGTSESEVPGMTRRAREYVNDLLKTIRA